MPEKLPEAVGNAAGTVIDNIRQLSTAVSV